MNATKTSGERAVYTAIEPCRLLDTRPNKNIQRNTPLGEGEIYAVSAIGDNGQCTGIPADTVALELNVTGLLNTAATDFVIWGGAGAPPNASHINLASGASPTPNSVTTELDGNSFSIRNKVGEAHVIVDIVGIYQDHNHDDLYYTESEVDARLDARLPIASAYINGDGTIEGGFGVSASTYDAGRYVLTLDGVSYFYKDYVTLVTGACQDRVVHTGSVLNDLLVYFEDLAGLSQTCSAGFAVQVYPLAN